MRLSVTYLTIQSYWKVRDSMKESETIREKRKFAIELKQLVHQKCVEINHYVSGCDSPFSYTQVADVQESLREIENTLNIKVGLER